MSGIEIVIIVGAGIYITKKVKENKEKKRLAKEAALASHGVAQEVQDASAAFQHSPYRNQIPHRQDERLPLYEAPTVKPSVGDEDTTDNQWSKEIRLPSYDEVPGGVQARHNEADTDALSRIRSGHASSSTSSPIASAVPTTSSGPPPPNPAVKKYRRFFQRSNRSKAEIPQES